MSIFVQGVDTMKYVLAGAGVLAFIWIVLSCLFDPPLSLWNKGRTYTPLRACALCRGLISAQGDFPALRYGGFAATRGCTPCAASRLSLHTHKNSTPAVGVCTVFAGFIILSGR